MPVFNRVLYDIRTISVLARAPHGRMGCGQTENSRWKIDLCSEEEVSYGNQSLTPTQSAV